jgi:hypothetical protein
MKTAIYIEDGVVQLVLTPENEFEKNAMSGFTDKNLEAQIFSGGFYDCRGGWVRQTAHQPRDPYSAMHRTYQPEDQSIILRVEQRSRFIPQAEEPQQEQPVVSAEPTYAEEAMVRAVDIPITREMLTHAYPAPPPEPMRVMEAPNEMPRLRR